MLLELGRDRVLVDERARRPSPVQDTVHAVTQCVLRVDDRSVRVAKAEGRDDGVRGTVLHWHQEGGRPVVAPAEIVGRVAASLRAVRRTRHLSQHDLGDLAGVSASAISQVERAERGLSLATLVRLSAALGVTIDDLLRGKEPGAYRIGRRTDDPQPAFEHTVALLGGDPTSGSTSSISARASPAARWRRRPAPASSPWRAGSCRSRSRARRPAVRHGEVLVADSETIAGWRNLGAAEAELFWIVSAQRQ